MVKPQGILRLLLVDTSLTDADSIINTLRSAGHSVRASRFDSLLDIEQALTNSTWDVIICRDTVPSIPPRELLAFIHRLGRDLPCIVVTENLEAIEALYSVGAQDVVLFDDVKRLQFSVARELQHLFMRRLYRRTERALRESEKRARLLLESSKDAVAYMHEGMHIYVNQAYLNLFGYDDQEDVSGLPFLDMVLTEDHAKFKATYRAFTEKTDAQPQTVDVTCVNSDGKAFMADIEFSHAQVEGEACTQVVVRDYSENLLLSDQSQLLREQDFLTGLFSREYFLDELARVAGQAGAGQNEAALLYIVIDEFNSIKAEIGLAESEMLIKHIAHALRKEAESSDFVARYSDQVFTVIVHSHDDDTIDSRAQAFIQAVRTGGFQVNNQPIDVSCSIGISRINEKQSSSELIIELADSACHNAVRAGGNTYIRNQPPLELGEEPVDEDETQQWQNRIQQAIEDDTLVLYFQPIVSLHGRDQQLYEVLLRWKNEDGSIVEASKFIEHVQQYKLMASVETWVLNKAMQCLVEHRQTHPTTRFFIKLSAQILENDDFIQSLQEQLHTHNLSGDAFVFEVSETIAFNNMERTALLVSQLKTIGCEFGLEHFGSGIDFSQSLTSLDVDYLKINGAFVENMAKDTENQAAVKAIIDITKEAGKSTIAEFVSDANSLALLWRFGVDYAQGYYIHEPSADLDYDFEDDDL